MTDRPAANPQLVGIRSADTPIAREAAVGGGRLQWLDAARGIGIVLVVYAHGARALPDVLPHPQLFRQVDQVIYAFHMQLFFLLAGLVSRTALNRSRSRYLNEKVITVVYPYLVWSLIYWALELMFASHVNSPISADSILYIWFKPIEHLWFLYVLFICQVLVAAMWPRILVLIAISMWCIFGPLPAISVPALWTHFPWFTAGLLLSPFLMRGLRDVPKHVVVAMGVALLFGLVGAIATNEPVARLSGFLMAGAGIALTIATAVILRSLWLIRYLGEASLSIYLMHTIFSAGAREILEVTYPVGGLTMLTITVFAGLVLPLAIHEFARRTDTAPVLGLGRMAPKGIQKIGRNRSSA